jgi:TonB family protein
MHDAYFATLQSRFSGTADNSPALFEDALRRAEAQVPGKQRKRFFPHCRRPARRQEPERYKKMLQLNRQLCFTLVFVMDRKAVFLFLALFLSHVAAAHADSVKDALRQKYQNQLLALRAPLTGRTQKFDSAGQPVNLPSAGEWLFYGGIYVEKLDVSNDKLSLEGPQVAPTDKKKKGKPVFVPIGKPVKVEIHLDQPLVSADQAQVVMDRVFFLGEEALHHTQPEYRRSDNAGSVGPVYSISKEGVKYPQSVYTPEPEFSEKARRAKYQGTVILNIVVDKEGNVSRIKLVRPLGMGLDENAMEGLKTWRFKPATRNGQPVAVEMNIEVAFNLY